MPLIKQTLENELTSLFEDPPSTGAECAQAWADAVATYMTPVIPASTTIGIASETLAASLAGIFATSTNATTTATSMEAAFLAFATTVGTGMVAAGYTGTPPVIQVGFLTMFQTPESTVSSAASKVATAVDTWARAGVATLIVSPFTVINWS